MIEDEIRVGEYVRTYNNGIKRIDTIWGNKTVNKYGYEVGSEWDGKLYSIIKTTDIVKHGKDIKDLLQVGDIIKYKIKVSTTLETKGYIEGITDITDEEHLQSIKDDENYKVLEVLTKEQYNSNRFKVKE